MTQTTRPDGPLQYTAEALNRPSLRLMRATSTRLAENRTAGSVAHSGWLAAIRAGITSAGQPAALPSAGSYLGQLSSAQQVGALRAAAIRAINKNVAQVSVRDDPDSPAFPARRGIGRSLAELYRAEHNGIYPSGNDAGDQIVQQVNILPMLDVESAAQVLNGLIGRCPGRVHIDFYNLADTLTNWGNGISPYSRRFRERIVTDFYGATN